MNRLAYDRANPNHVQGGLSTGGEFTSAGGTNQGGAAGTPGLVIKVLPGGIIGIQMSPAFAVAVAQFLNQLDPHMNPLKSYVIKALETRSPLALQDAIRLHAYLNRYLSGKGTRLSGNDALLREVFTELGKAINTARGNG